MSNYSNSIAKNSNAYALRVELAHKQNKPVDKINRYIKALAYSQNFLQVANALQLDSASIIESISVFGADKMLQVCNYAISKDSDSLKSELALAWQVLRKNDIEGIPMDSLVQLIIAQDSKGRIASTWQSQLSQIGIVLELLGLATSKTEGKIKSFTFRKWQAFDAFLRRF